MSESHSLLAADPYKNATVSASAGSGKTWLLVTRILRLLLAGAEPSSILALTFTRKAADEMAIRLDERLFALAQADDEELDQLLTTVGVIEIDDEQRKAARALYDRCLHAVHPVKILTFHAFCQDLLSRFPLEADVPPGFELLEDTSQLERRAWETLFTKATSDTESMLSEDLDQLMQHLNGPFNLQKTLVSFLDQRSDWWAFTEHQNKPAHFAADRLMHQLELEDTSDPTTHLMADLPTDDLREFLELIEKHPTKENKQFAEKLARLLSPSTNKKIDFGTLVDVFLTKELKPRARKYNKTLEKKMGADGADRFLEIHESLCGLLLQTLEAEKRLETYLLNRSWYRAGHQLIAIFQRLKRELRYLDFSDLEWVCYQLLNSSDNALWIQYKIDQRIDHFLIDEFQDTNPTQWLLLKPLLEEIAANPEERWRSIFLVGDPKQSIYGFRRANPALQSTAAEWLREHLSSIEAPLDASRRSSPAIIDCVNAIFSQEQLLGRFADFSLHDTHQIDLPGKTTLLPVCEPEEILDAIQERQTLRNPLLEPRVIAGEDDRHQEAETIAEQINCLITDKVPIFKDGVTRPVMYRDIMILMRSRTHSHIYERSLKIKGIPYLSNSRGGFIDNLEINDLEKLLDSLITPFNDLSIAQVLRSPIFSIDHEDLISLARSDKSDSWYQRLSTLAEEQPDNVKINRAFRLLSRWQQLADTIPVHDLLDRIYTEGNIVQRYRASVPDAMKRQVIANLQQFLEMSLELNSGRYPTLSCFLDHIRSFQTNFSQSPDEPIIADDENCVRLMTIHASKGLESPVVFLIDSATRFSNHDAHSTLVDWPSGVDRPEHFQLLPTKKRVDSKTAAIIDKKKKFEDRENINLLYVAMTRARQYLYISGTRTKNKKEKQRLDWYQLIEDGLRAMSTETEKGLLTHASGDLSYAGSHISQTQEGMVDIDPRLTTPISNITPKRRMVSPSKSVNATTIDASSRTTHLAIERGIIIHRALELLTQNSAPSEEDLTATLHAQNAHLDNVDLSTFISEAISVYRDPKLSKLFDPGQFDRSMSECPLLFQEGNKTVYGIADLIVFKNSDLSIIDYKSNQINEEDDLEVLKDQYSKQMQYYREGASRIWPDFKIKTGLLFTRTRQLVWM